MRGKNFYSISLIFLVLIVSYGTLGVSAAVMVSSPDSIKPGDTVSVSVGNLDPGTLRINITGQLKTDAGSPFTVHVRDLMLPKNLTNTRLTLQMQNILPLSYGTLSFDGGGYNVKKTKMADGTTWFYNGPVTPLNLNAGTYNLIFNGTANRNQVPVVKAGIEGSIDAITDIQQYTFNIVGISSGIFNIELFSNDNRVAIKAFTIQDSLI